MVAWATAPRHPDGYQVRLDECNWGYRDGGGLNVSIRLPFGGPDAKFDVDRLVEHLKDSGREFIIQGQAHRALSVHPKPRSLDVWLRRNFASNPDIKQAVNEVIDQLVSTALFEKGQFVCPDSGRLCKGIKLVKGITGSVIRGVISPCASRRPLANARGSATLLSRDRQGAVAQSIRAPRIAEPSGPAVETTMTQADRDRRAYALAKEYILGLPGVTAELLAHYQTPPPRPMDLAQIYRRLLDSAQNRGMASNVIGRSIGGLQNLSGVTFGFNPLEVSQCYQGGDELLSEIIATVRPRGKVRRTSRGLWPRFCDSALSGAGFLAGFGSAQEFYAWVDAFHDDDRKVPALPLILSKEITGFGFALACDFLMELGYFKLTKPDVHVRAIVRGVRLSEPKADDYAIFKAVLRIARNQGTTAYDVDKTFWLVGSGFFYDHPELGRKGRIRTDRDGFIQWARGQLDHDAGSDPAAVDPSSSGAGTKHTSRRPKCARDTQMTHAEQIFRAAAALTGESHTGTFTRKQVREWLGLKPGVWSSGYAAVFQGMREDHPGGAPPVGTKHTDVFHRVAHGTYRLSAGGRQLAE